MESNNKSMKVKRYEKPKKCIYCGGSNFTETCMQVGMEKIYSPEKHETIWTKDNEFIRVFVCKDCGFVMNFII
jgi:predicted nucleic-acid-binding Zn-ribbon protein